MQGKAVVGKGCLHKPWEVPNMGKLSLKWFTPHMRMHTHTCIHTHTLALNWKSQGTSFLIPARVAALGTCPLLNQSGYLGIGSALPTWACVTCPAQSRGKEVGP